ncbi:hypothetical protein F5Y07DRAFT_225104 [Xylaria sp. FL0933]|nr:hypothetical protein F5Y07DRAFT_225104 [Xylaria sp. FL0933]
MRCSSSRHRWTGGPDASGVWFLSSIALDLARSGPIPSLHHSTDLSHGHTPLVSDDRPTIPLHAPRTLGTDYMTLLTSKPITQAQRQDGRAPSPSIPSVSSRLGILLIPYFQSISLYLPLPRSRPLAGCGDSPLAWRDISLLRRTDSWIAGISVFDPLRGALPIPPFPLTP